VGDTGDTNLFFFSLFSTAGVLAMWVSCKIDMARNCTIATTQKIKGATRQPGSAHADAFRRTNSRRIISQISPRIHITSPQWFSSVCTKPQHSSALMSNAAGNDSFASKLMSLQAADSFGSRTGVAVTAVVKRENDQTGNSQDWQESYCTETPDSDFYPSAEGQFFDSDDSSFDWFEHVLITI